jgi:hypothetical protein
MPEIEQWPEGQHFVVSVEELKGAGDENTLLFRFLCGVLRLVVDQYDYHQFLAEAPGRWVEVSNPSADRYRVILLSDQDRR